MQNIYENEKVLAYKERDKLWIKNKETLHKVLIDDDDFIEIMRYFHRDKTSKVKKSNADDYGVIRGLDPEIKPLVRALNKLPGCKTYASCWGHPDMNILDEFYENKMNNESWISFTVKLEKLNDFMNVCNQMDLRRNTIHGNIGLKGYVDFSIQPSSLSSSKKSMNGVLIIYHDIDYMNGVEDWLKNLDILTKEIERVAINKL